MTLLIQTVCTVCNKPLSGGLGTYGDLDRPLCQSCYLAAAKTPDEIEAEEIATMNGLADEIGDIDFMLVDIETEIDRLTQQLNGLKADKSDYLKRRLTIIAEMQKHGYYVP